jgi:hypothetical protein
MKAADASPALSCVEMMQLVNKAAGGDIKAITVLLGELRPLNGETAQSSSDSSPARPCRRAEGNYLQL